MLIGDPQMDMWYQPLPWANPPPVINLPQTMDATGPLPSTPNPCSDRPSHYGPVDPYAYALANDLGPLEMNVVKYVTRWKKKDGLKDLKKALNTIQRLIAHEEDQIVERIHDRCG